MSVAASTGEGPFRDGFDKAACATLEGERGLDALRRARRLEIELSTLMYLLALGPIALALATARLEPGVFGFVSVVLGSTLGKVRQQREDAVLRADLSPRRVWISESGLLIEDLGGPSRWSWSAVRGVDLVEGGAVLHFNPGTPMALRASRGQVERLRALIKPRFFDRVGRYYLALAVAYVGLAAPLALFAYLAG